LVVHVDLPIDSESRIEHFPSGDDFACACLDGYDWELEAPWVF
jgi:hypothetical protein